MKKLHSLVVALSFVGHVPSVTTIGTAVGGERGGMVGGKVGDVGSRANGTKELHISTVGGYNELAQMVDNIHFGYVETRVYTVDGTFLRYVQTPNDTNPTTIVSLFTGS